MRGRLQHLLSSNRWRRAILLLAFIGTVQAAPMGFKDSWMVMAENSASWQDISANYALTPRWAVGAGSTFMRSDDKATSRTLTQATATHLAKRWNMPEAQANVWLLGGVGSVSGNDFSGSRTMVTPGFQLDYETTRIYSAMTARFNRADGLNHDMLSLRAGFSLYEADYDEPQPWFIVEARRMNGLSEATEVTPMLRIIHKRYFFEVGVNQKNEVRTNLMLNF